MFRGLLGLGLGKLGQDAKRIVGCVEIECIGRFFGNFSEGGQDLGVRGSNCFGSLSRLGRHHRRGSGRRGDQRVDQRGIAVEYFFAGATTYYAPTQLQLVSSDPKDGVAMGAFGGEGHRSC
ncbi:MJ0042 family finger-like domain protein [Janthinobacterium agaricidamnosum NBRC 102515 = DSM 9628]|uniref:MJ0042 family finger-like domain protein n=1 Tax=Janthinobacterium agaricidamnosum NBRC 102515 = DSM 9628 TaxID=1349767 RepID=W0UXX3_9BURK|nr:MJ0042 family finger-like domain protein [Janthinobacterium agaricidamnosum NBRC 102515 = DSM 9628]